MTASSWVKASVAECLAPVRVAGKAKLQTRDYKKVGRFPVIDQGQQAIAGWTDDASVAIDSPLPLIVFGDHTRILKFVDRPFARGADGTQLLRPLPTIDPLFFFFACRAIDVPARGYNRHFTMLKQQTLSYPLDVGEQRAIGAVLRQVESAGRQQFTMLENLISLKLATLALLMTQGETGGAQKESQVGPIPSHWQECSLREHFHVASGGTPSRDHMEYWAGGTIPWVKTGEINYSDITQSEEHITPEGIVGSSAKCFPAGTLLMAMFGQGVTRGRVAFLAIEASCNQACAAIQPADGEIDARFLYHFLTWRYEKIRSLAHGGQQQNLNLEIVRNMPVVFPQCRDEQNRIVAILDSIDRKLDMHRRKATILDELFKALLHKLMTGQIRATDLDMSAIADGSLAEMAS
jgi:type I restriction enzyme, S subunit